MKLASFTIDGHDSYGLVAGDGIVDVGRRLGARFPSLRAVLAAGALGEIAGFAGQPPDHALSALRLALPIPEPGKIICVGRNYRGHVAEANLKLPDHPAVFIRATESFVPSGATLLLPELSENFDYEGELALVIGKRARHVAAADAPGCIAGYTCLNDGSIRDYQFNHSLTVGKNFFRSGSIGPWMVTRDEIGDPAKLTLRTTLNGREVQKTGTDDLIFDIPYIVSYLSGVLPLNPGDIVATGTPEGVGFSRTPPLWLKHGDVVEIEISGIGVLRNDVAAQAAD